MTSDGGSIDHEVTKETSTARKLGAIREHPLTKPLALLLAALLPAIAGWINSNRALQAKSAEVKDKAEAGFQQGSNWLDEQQIFNRGVVADLQKLKAEIAELKRRQIRPVVRREAAQRAAVAAVPAPSPALTLPSAPLSPNLDRALEQVQKAAATTPPPPAPSPALPSPGFPPAPPPN